MRSLNIASTGMLAQQLNVEVISNNIANVNTTAYKRQRAEFQDLMYENIRRPGTQSSDTGTILPAGVQLGSGVRAASVYRIGEQGSFTSTSNPLDVVTPEGFIISPSITIPSEAVDIQINANGEVQVKFDGDSESVIVGQLDMARFLNKAGMEAVGDNMFLETAASGPATIGVPGSPGYGLILQGFLESSNVNPVEEITNLIAAQRAYEMNSKVITTSDEMMRTVATLR
jgi:flagellar basal-body rod protein FlgG